MDAIGRIQAKPLKFLKRGLYRQFGFTFPDIRVLQPFAEDTDWSEWLNERCPVGRKIYPETAVISRVIGK
jgi:hypothetical protein